AITACHAFPVKRGAADRGAIKAALQVLKEGRCLGLFPEGTRSRTGKMGKAEAGVGLIAAMSGAPIVPAAIIGTDKIFANGGHFPKLKVIYGEPLQFTGDHKDKEALAAFSQQVMDKIAALKAEYQM
ncbi:MAG: 1-acyl-sn-glycerol-3-phosphate acyltransferase, partial [Selenomonas sp.]|nr:1-acyl-sn-glycerol-3-phosphate acyltransferase [Selenomonas sp.]